MTPDFDSLLMLSECVFSLIEKGRDQIELIRFRQERENELDYLSRKNERKSEKQKAPGFVYVLKCENSNLVKIGRSKHENIRIEHLKTANPWIKKIACVRVLEPVPEERGLHKKFESQRKSGEWFSLDEDQVEYILNHLNSVEYAEH